MDYYYIVEEPVSAYTAILLIVLFLALAGFGVSACLDRQALWDRCQSACAPDRLTAVDRVRHNRRRAICVCDSLRPPNYHRDVVVPVP
jgi:hypothetical protein